MASGGREMIINPQERALSSDVNRLQKFLAGDRAEILRWLIDVLVDPNTGLPTEYGTVGTPLRAEILGGFVCVPQSANNSVFVSPGVLLAIAPDSAPDDSNYKYLLDPSGVSSLGALTIAPNPGGSARIDVVEVQIAAPPANVVETDNRDIFNPISGAFTASTVNKVIRSTASYRVRQGTVGGGFPGTVAGWLPLMVASVPAAAATNADCAFWDVRPLLVDRVKAPLNTVATGRPNGRFNYPENHYRCDDGTNGVPVDNTGTLAFHGVMRVAFRGREYGGQFVEGGFSAGAPDIIGHDTEDFTGLFPANVSNAGGMWAVWCLVPFGLPRWCRYATSGSQLLPNTFKGILVSSYTLPADESGDPANPISLPAWTGLLGTTTSAFAVMFGNYSSGGPTYNAGVVVGDRFTGFLSLAQHAYNSNPTKQFVPSDGFFPANARELFVGYFASGNLVGLSSGPNQWSMQFLLSQKLGSGPYVQIGQDSGSQAIYNNPSSGTPASTVNGPAAGNWATVPINQYNWPESTGSKTYRIFVSSNNLTSLFSGTPTVGFSVWGFRW